MSLFQIGFLALVFVGTFGLVWWLAQFAGGGANSQRMRRMLGEPAAVDSPAERFVERLKSRGIVLPESLFDPGRRME